MHQKRPDGIVRRVIHRGAYAASWVSMVSLCLMMFLTASDVGGRYLFNQPITGAQDITELLMVLAVFMGIPYVQLTKGHIRVDVLTSKLSKHSQAILEIVSSILAAAIFALIAWQLGKRAWVSLLSPGLYHTQFINIPIGPFVLVAAIGSFALFMVLLVDLVDSLAQIRR